jgi:glutamate-ammonia-ligase adenylyltransferase
VTRNGRTVSRTTLLRRAGVHDPARAEKLLDEPALAPYLAGELEDRLLLALRRAGDPDHALLTLVRMAERAAELNEPALVDELASDDVALARLIAVTGASRALGDGLVGHPTDVVALLDRDGAPPALGRGAAAERRGALEAVGADPADPNPVASLSGEEGIGALRRAYRRRLLAIAAADLTSPDPLADFTTVASSIADIVGAALDAALAVARADLPDHGQGVRLAVLGMGKTGGKEINYISDVDVVYVAEPALGEDGEPVVDEHAALEVATRLA